MNPSLSIPLQLFAAGLALTLGTSLAGAQQLSFTPFNRCGIYELGEKAGWSVRLPEGSASPTAAYSYIIRTNNFSTIKAGMIDLSSGADTIETTLSEPGILYFEVASAFSL